jgi:hypothetical protein
MATNEDRAVQAAQDTVVRETDEGYRVLSAPEKSVTHQHDTDRIPEKDITQGMLSNTRENPEAWLMFGGGCSGAGSLPYIHIVVLVLSGQGVRLNLCDYTAWAVSASQTPSHNLAPVSGSYITVITDRHRKIFTTAVRCIDWLMLNGSVPQTTSENPTFGEIRRDVLNK